MPVLLVGFELLLPMVGGVDDDIYFFGETPFLARYQEGTAKFSSSPHKARIKIKINSTDQNFLYLRLDKTYYLKINNISNA